MKLRHGLTLIFAVASCSGSDVAPEPDNQPKNHRPVLVEIPDTLVTVGSVLFLQVDGSDPDGDSLAFHGSVGSSLSDFRAGTLPIFHFDVPSRTLVFTPRDYDRPARWAILWAEDGRGSVDTMTVHMFVN